MDIGHILSTSPPIVENIFKYLCARDLCSSAQVCSMWKSMAYTEKKRRKNVVWFCKVALAPDYPTPRNVTHHGTDSWLVEREHQLQMEQNQVEPAFCMAFASTQFVEIFPDIFRYETSSETSMTKREERFHSTWKRKYLAAVIKTTLKRYLPAHCPVTFAVTPGIVGCCSNMCPIEVEDGVALSGFLLPKVDGMNIYHFPVCRRNYEVTELLPEGTKIKCLLVFLTSRGMSMSNRLISSCLMRENCRLAVGGGIVDRTESSSGSVVAICGENVTAASVIIGVHDKQEEAKAKLEKFRDAGLLQNRRVFAYMFACVGRGYSLYHEPNVESLLFHKLYPRVPLVGLFGNGEIGITYFPHLPSVHRFIQIGKFQKSIKKYLHSYTTVFVMVSIKD